MPLIVYYKLPDEFGEDVMVTENPVFECQPAILFTKHDEGLPLFNIYIEGEHTEATPSNASEPTYTILNDGLAATLPARNQAEAVGWARSFYERVVTHRETEAV